MRYFPLLSLALTFASPVASAQLRLPTVPSLAQPLSALDRTLDDAQARSAAALSQARKLQIGRIIQANPRTLDVDEHGNPIVRGELLALSPSESGLQRAVTLHLEVVREQNDEAVHGRIVVFKIASGESARKTLSKLREADPSGVYDYNHIYLGSGWEGEANTRASQTGATNDAEGSMPIRIGLLDTGVDASHTVFHGTRLHAWGCEGEPIADAHGTAVASLMVGDAAKFHGVLRRAELFAADVFCGKPTGGAVATLVSAFDWMVQQHVPVINVSLVGPPNALLERVIANLIAQGFVIVAAVGNDGPAAPPLYPASYPQVVGVTGVDAHNKALVEAARGPQVMFASPGADLAAAVGDSGYSSVRGTSFAAPIVAALLAERLTSPSPALATAAIDDLVKSADHLGRAGRDLTYGFGVVGAQYRTDPARLVHR